MDIKSHLILKWKFSWWFLFFGINNKKTMFVRQRSIFVFHGEKFRHYSESYYQLLYEALPKFYASLSALKILIDNMWKIWYKVQWYIYIREKRNIEFSEEQRDTETKIDGKRIRNEPVSIFDMQFFFTVLFSQETRKI